MHKSRWCFNTLTARAYLRWLGNQYASRCLSVKSVLKNLNPLEMSIWNWKRPRKPEVQLQRIRWGSAEVFRLATLKFITFLLSFVRSLTSCRDLRNDTRSDCNMLYYVCILVCILSLSLMLLRCNLHAFQWIVCNCCVH